MKPVLIWYRGIGHWCDAVPDSDLDAYTSRVDGAIFFQCGSQRGVQPQGGYK